MKPRRQWTSSFAGSAAAPSSSALMHGAFNIASASGIVFANKYVFTACAFRFTVTLTAIHTVVTLLGLAAARACGLYSSARHLRGRDVLPLAAAYVAYVVLGNASLRLNPVGVYQVLKIAVAPTVIALEALMFRRLPKPRAVLAAVAVVCLGVGLATVSLHRPGSASSIGDDRRGPRFSGAVAGAGATLATALYQIWAGSKQRELRVSSLQLLAAYTPASAGMLLVLAPLLDSPTALLAYAWTPGRAAAVLGSGLLGLAVSLSTFLFIGATSSLTYNVVGHVKTLIILAGGVAFFGDAMPLRKVAGVAVAMAGIMWYTQLKSHHPTSKPAAGSMMTLPVVAPRPLEWGQARRHASNARALN